MNGSSLQFIKSQSGFVSDVIRNILGEDGFVILCGESGSGRSVICEQVINATDRRAQAVFIPCQHDMSLIKLRQLFLGQFASADPDMDPQQPLPDSLVAQKFIGRRKVLAVIDNADQAQNAFYDELRQVFEAYDGQNRFSCLLTGSPAWARSKTGSRGVTAMSIPPLSTEEAMNLCLNMFRLRGKLPEFRSIEKTLPAVLAACAGNVDRIIAKTEELMKDPTGLKGIADSAQADRERPGADDQGAGSAAISKKSGSTGLFVAVVGVLLVLVALIPMFVGGGYGSIMSMVTGKEKSETGTAPASSSANTTVTVTSAPFTSAHTPPPAFSERRFSAGTAQAADRITTDRGRLSEAVPVGIEAEAITPQMTRKTVIAGQALEDIEAERSARESAIGPGGPMRVQNPIQADNRLRKSEITQQEALEQQEFARKSEALKTAAQSKTPTGGQSASASAAGKGNETAAVAEAAGSDKPARRTDQATQTAASAASAKGEGVVRADKVPDSGKAVPGSRDELLGKKSDSYTLQVVAGHSREKIVDASSGITGRYWIYETRHNNRPWYVLVTGEYRSVAEANSAIRQLPKALVKAKPFPKSFGKIKQEMAAAR